MGLGLHARRIVSTQMRRMPIYGSCMLGLSKQRELQTRWQRVAGLILEEADIGAVSRQLELALFMDAKLDVAKMPA